MADLPRDDKRPVPVRRGVLDALIQAPPADEVPIDPDVEMVLREMLQDAGMDPDLSVILAGPTPPPALLEEFYTRFRAAMEQQQAQVDAALKETQLAENDALIEEIRLEERSRDQP